MKKLASILLISLAFMCGPAVAQIIPSLPYNLTNGTLADANQVMANFNQIVSSTNTNAANAGANTNITALLGLTTPLAPSVGGSSVYTGGASSGSANAQTLLNPTPLGFSLVSGRRVTFIAGFTNNGATTFNINSTGAIAVLKQSPSGLVALSGGEIVLNQGVDAWYDGTQYQLFNAAPQSTVQPCTTIDYQGVAIPSGYLATAGQAVSRVTYANLFGCMAYSGLAANTTSGSGAIIFSSPTSLQVGWYVGGANVTCNSTITVITDSTHITINNTAGATGATTLTAGPEPQGDCSTTFNLPNNSGRATAQTDSSGSVLSNTTCTGHASIGTTCGSETKTLGTNNLPAYTPAGTITNGAISFLTSATTQVAGSGATAVVLGVTSTGSNLTTILGPSQAVSTFAGTAQGGTDVPVSSLAPIKLVLKAIKT